MSPVVTHAGDAIYTKGWSKKRKNGDAKYEKLKLELGLILLHKGFKKYIMVTSSTSVIMMVKFKEANYYLFIYFYNKVQQ